jgi:branched-chain amino acid transport system substrate-binding protein
MRSGRSPALLGRSTPALIRDLRDGREVDCDGASGPIDLDEHGDPTAGTYDILEFTGGKLVPIRQLRVENGS